jgi:hypothetical protein
MIVSFLKWVGEAAILGHFCEGDKKAVVFWGDGVDSA